MEKSITCKNCNKSFQVTDEDTKFYEKMGVPASTHCPDCRQQRKMLQMNQINLFKRKCDLTGETIISSFPQDSEYKVFSQKSWYSDLHDGEKYGQEFDFSRPFFEQYAELSKKVPVPALLTDYTRDENCEYTNCAGKNKNCYLIFDSDENWDCMYSYGMNGSRSSLDCLRVQEMELCYEAVDSKNCYNCAYVTNSENCTDSYFINNCIGCRNCIYCSNLRNKQYHFQNKKIPKEEFEKLKEPLENYTVLQEKIQEFKKIKPKFPQKFLQGFQNENVTGNYLVNCKNAINCFDSMNIWDVKNCTQVFIGAKNCMDIVECGECELLYECNHLGYNAYNLRFCMQCFNQISNLTYCKFCFTSSDLFGCVGLKKKKYCILNKQYSKEEYEALVKKIIEHMKKTKEWGEYFPAQISYHPYNLSVANEYYPLTKEQAVSKGYKWRDEDKKEYLKQTYTIPDSTREVPDTIINETLACKTCGKNFKITTAELNFYKKQNFPIPRKCFHCRHKERVNSRAPRKLFDSICGKCGAKITTCYTKELADHVYCEKCYLESVI